MLPFGLEFAHEVGDLRARIVAEYRAIGDKIEITQVWHAFQPIVAIPGFRAEKRLVHAGRAQLPCGAQPPGGNEQITIKSGCLGSALMRVIWLAICGSSPPNCLRQ